MRRFKFFGCLFLFCGGACVAYADDEAKSADGEFEAHEVLFLLEEAYTQEKAETQIGIGVDFDNGDDYEIEVEIEYGVTDALQLVLEAPFEKDGSDGLEFGRLEFGADLAVLKDEGTGVTPQITFGLAFGAPTGDARGWLVEPSLRFAKMVSDSLFVHTLFAAEYFVEDGTSRWQEWQFGAGVGLMPDDQWAFTIEYLREAESQGAGWEAQHFGALSIAFEFPHELTVGAALVQSVDGGDETRGIFKAQIEW